MRHEPAAAAAAQPCGATVWASGAAYHVSPGERGRIMQLDAGGQPLLVMVTEGPAAAELLTTLRFELTPLPGQVEDALRLPYFAPALAPGQRYYVDKVASELGVVVTAPAEAVTASQRDEVAWFGDPEQPAAARHYDFVAVDAASAVRQRGPVTGSRTPSPDRAASPSGSCGGSSSAPSRSLTTRCSG